MEALIESQSILSEPLRLTAGFIPNSLLELVRETTQNGELREQLGAETQAWRCISGSFKSSLEYWNSGANPFLRTLNGVAIVARNLVSATGGQGAQLANEYDCFTSAIEILSKAEFQSSTEIEVTKLRTSLWQFLANGSLSLQMADNHDKTLLNVFEQVMQMPGLEADNVPLLAIIGAVLRDPATHKQAINILCNNTNAQTLVNKILIEAPLWYSGSEGGSNVEAEQNRLTSLVHGLGVEIINHQSMDIVLKAFGRSQGQTENSLVKILDASLESCMRGLNKEACVSASCAVLAQLELTAQWALPFIRSAELNPEYSDVIRNQIHEIWNSLNLCLDMMHSLLDGPHGVSTVKTYLVDNTDIVKGLVLLLGEAQQNLPKRSKLADLAEAKSPGSDLDYEPQDFPLIKGKIIYILGVLSMRTPKVQDLMREVHGLELVLSNCIIDLNNPYIKERSIVCIRCLLEGNDANQAFVAKMEAKQSVTPDALHEAGYETEIIDGKIALKKKRT